MCGETNDFTLSCPCVHLRLLRERAVRRGLDPLASNRSGAGWGMDRGRREEGTRSFGVSGDFDLFFGMFHGFKFLEYSLLFFGLLVMSISLHLWSKSSLRIILRLLFVLFLHLLSEGACVAPFWTEADCWSRYFLRMILVTCWERTHRAS